MKNLLRFACAGCAAAVISSGPLIAQTWQTILDYQLAPGQFAEGSALAADAAGNIFSGGTAADGPGSLIDHGHRLVLKTDTAAVNWYLSDDPTPSSSQYGSRAGSGLGFDSNGNLYSVGSLTPKGSSYPSYWLIRKSSDSGVSWSTTGPTSMCSLLARARSQVRPPSEQTPQENPL